MSRVLILLMFVFWLAWKPGPDGFAIQTGWPAASSVAVFLGVYGVLVLATGVWCRRLVRTLTTTHMHRSLARLTRIMFMARAFIPLWFLVGMFVLGWADEVDRVLRLLGTDLSQTLAGLVVATFPPFAAWAGLWWSQYPAEVAFREEGIESRLRGDLPVHRPPTFRSYFASNLRLQLMFMVVPVLLIALLHDLFRLVAGALPTLSWGLNDPENPLTWVAAAGVVFVFAPEILRRILRTEPLPNSPLRRRLESLCRRAGVKYRQILLWHTDNNFGNAAVMGFIPRLRYILLSDLLLETMSDEEVEAVFAHELGHVVHKHMVWLVVFFAVLTMFVMGIGAWLGQWMARYGIKDGPAEGLVIASAYLLKFLLLFGFVSRRFERQADVFAARTMELSRAAVPGSSASEVLLAARQLSLAAATTSAGGALAVYEKGNLENGHVGRYGAHIFGSALQRVAIVNNIPVKARSWCHGSIATRMQYLRELSTDPARTARFDRFMLFLYGALVFGLFAGAAFCWAANAVP